jgi:2,4-dienoyl-CoA reductase (NADPH2)
VTPSAVQKKIMVIGAGPAGMEFALTAAQRGHEVIVFDGAETVGGNLVGYARHDLANKADLFKLVGYYQTRAERLGIQLQLQTDIDPKLLRTALPDYDVAVVASGAKVPLESVPRADGNLPVLDALRIARQELDLGKRVVIFGGGKVGLVLAESLADRGVQVTIVEEQKRIAGDVLPTWKWRHTAWVEQLKIPVLTGTRLRFLSDDGVMVEDKEGVQVFLPADAVIMASPRQSDQHLFGELEYLVDEVYLIGDAVAPRGLQHAIHDGYRLGVRV